MDRKLLFATTILILMTNIGSATEYSTGDSDYGYFYNMNAGESNVYSKGFELPFSPYYYSQNDFVIYNNTIYLLNVGGAEAAGFYKYNLVGNVSIWNNSVYVPSGYHQRRLYIVVDDDSVVTKGHTGLIEYDQTDGAIISNFTITNPTYTPISGYITDEFTYPGSPYTRLGVAGDVVTMYDKFYPNGSDVYSPYYSSYPNPSGSDLGTSYYNPNTYMIYSFEPTVVAGPFSVDAGWFNGSEVVIAIDNSDMSLGFTIDATRQEIPIYDSTNHYFIRRVTTGNGVLGNLSIVIKEPTTLPFNKISKKCEVTGSCGGNGTEYYSLCTKVGGIQTYSCASDVDCQGEGSPNARLCLQVDADGGKRCVNSTVDGTCQIKLKNPCGVLIPNPDYIHHMTYDSSYQRLYMFAHNTSYDTEDIWVADIGGCSFNVQTNITATLLGSYGLNTLHDSSSFSVQPIMDKDNIYMGVRNGTGDYFTIIDRAFGTVKYNRLLEKSVYNATMSGNAAYTFYEYGYEGIYLGTQIGYDTYTKSLYALVDGNKMIQFGASNETFCPNEDEHIADPMCYTNGTLDLIDHRYCDTSMNPTDTQICRDKIVVDTACTRDWQCVAGGNQGWCDIHYTLECKVTDSSLNYNYTTGKLSWSEASDPPWYPLNVFIVYVIVSGNELSLFDSYSVEQTIAGAEYAKGITEYTLNLSSDLYYRVVGASFGISGLKEYWKTDIIKGSDVLPSTTTTTTSTTTTSTLPAYVACTNSSNCSSGYVCCNGSCISKVIKPCCTDPDCTAGKWCSTRWSTPMCTSTAGLGQFCARNHECTSNNCTVHTNNSVVGDYPDPYNSPFYQYYGVCVNSSVTGCQSDADCNATSFCNLNNQWGVCEGKRGLGGSCQTTSWCIADLNCVNGICMNLSDYGENECTLGSIPANGDHHIWTTCRENYPAKCNTTGSSDQCFCGQLNVSNITLTCNQRVQQGGICSLFRPQYSSIEERYLRRDYACYSGYTCRGNTLSGIVGRLCTDNAIQCLRNRDTSWSYYSNTFFDEYCTDSDQWCDINGTDGYGNKVCRPLKAVGANCTLYYECGSHTCNNGMCGFGTITNGTTKVIVSAQPSRVNNGDGVTISATFKYSNNNTLISGGTCTLSVDSADFYVPNDVLLIIGNTYASEHIYANATSTTKNATVQVTCAKSGVDSGFGQTFVEILGGAGGIPTRIDCVSTCPNDGVVNQPVVFDVYYANFSNLKKISGATCLLTTDGSDYSMGSVSGSVGRYRVAHNFSSAGGRNYNITCSKTGYETYILTNTISISTTTPTLPPSQYCSDTLVNHGETGLNCGGTSGCGACPSCSNSVSDNTCACRINSDCESNWCRPAWGTQTNVTTLDRHCRESSCTDGWQNGDEQTIDCGGGCGTGLCGICYNPPTCRSDGSGDDGSLTCNITVWQYIEWECSSDSQCTTLSCIDEHGTSTTRDRFCSDGLCKWKSTNVSGGTAVNMNIYPLSGIYFNSNGSHSYLTYCNDQTNGFEVKTGVSTITSYIIDTAEVPSLSASGVWKEFGTEGKDKKVLLSELCTWTGGGALRFGNISFESKVSGTPHGEEQTIHVIAFRETFKVNMTGNGDILNFTANRAAVYSLKEGQTEGYTPINNGTPMVSLKIYYPNITNTTGGIYWMANSTYGETVEGKYSRDWFYLLTTGLGVLYDIFFAWWMPSWAIWMIIPLILIVTTVIPLGIILLVWLYFRQRSGGGE